MMILNNDSTNQEHPEDKVENELEKVANSSIDEETISQILEEERESEVDENEIIATDEQSIKSRKKLASWLYPVIFAVVLAVIIKLFVIDIKTIEGSSMAPNYESGNHVIVIRSWLNSNYKRGQVIVFQTDINEESFYVKRIIGVPGDELKIFMGQVFVNGEMISENYLHGKPDTLSEGNNRWKLGKGEYFVMGDNRLPGGSLDSRDFGPIKWEQVFGTVWERGNYESE
ncbi:MAG: signal peptidase I [Tissierellia bacterium]|nr:signal peptidase I [Tissierellia bacterium]